MNYSKQDPKTIQSLFDSIADQYDKTNGILSLQMHKKWNSTLVQGVLVANSPTTFLDLCCGTGAIAFEYLRMETTPQTKAYMLDFSEGMLECAKQQCAKKSQTSVPHQIEFIQANAEKIPLEDGCVDCVTVAYGIRNVKDTKKCLKEVFRVLRPGGVFGILELTEPTNPLVRFGHKLYLKTLLPILGKLCTSNKEAYNYLCKSIPTFIPPQELKALMESTGFQDVTLKPLLMGVATIVIGRKI